MKIVHQLLIFLSLVFLIGCTEDSVSTLPTSDTPNILLIIADDLGKDALNGYSEGTFKPNTPNIDALRNDGLTFNNFWVYPTCTPTRASIITGKYAYRSGVKWVGDILDPSEITIQKHINDASNNKYATAIVGKWHLSGSDASAEPEAYGIDYYAGLIRGAVTDYYEWQFTEDGVSRTVEEYATEYFTDLSIDWVDQQSKPWFLWLAYNAPHTPYHVPPSNMHDQGALPEYMDGNDPTPYYLAAIEAMDFQIGKLLSAIPQEVVENTTIIFIGDNGTPVDVAQSPYTRRSAKGSLYQGGINVPMVVSGHGVSRKGLDDHLITSTDLFATISELAGIVTGEINDGKSFKPLLSDAQTIRNYQYSEMNDGNVDAWTIANEEYKLIVNLNDEQEMYDLLADPYERNDLLDGTLSAEEVMAKEALELELANIRK